MQTAQLKHSLNKTLGSFISILPIITGMLLLTSWLLVIMPDKLATSLFSGNAFFDTLLAATFGSIAVGHPLVSYVLGGELRDAGVSLLPVTAFIVSWVTVGVVQLPAEILFFGKRFAFSRNLISFFCAMAVAMLMVISLRLLT
jgi:hypothetical protein